MKLLEIALMAKFTRAGIALLSKTTFVWQRSQIRVISLRLELVTFEAAGHVRSEARSEMS